ncbi:phage GP46 family protein [Rhizobium sp. 11_C7_N12_5]|uniref:phage GP46 family protein n=1 Tax=Rhizobium sp. 11_C7_N12_5 TaxID=3240770 RepID=UPI003F2325EB
MSNIRIAPGQGTEAITLDWLTTGQNTLDSTHDLISAVLMAIGTDMRANADDELPVDGDADLRGWWGDTDAQEIWGGWQVGSRLWLLNRAKITDENYKYGATVARARTYLIECLQPFLDQRIATKLEVDVQRYNETSISASIVLYRGNKSLISLQFQDLWDDIS